MTDEITIWEPAPFEKGTDLLPLEAMQQFGPTDVEVEEDTDLEPDDIVLPTLTILQGTSEPVKQQVEGATPGKLFLSATQEVLEPPLRVLVVHRFRGNALFVRKSNPEHEGLETCISRDGVTGHRYGDCESCGKCTEWRDDAKPLGTKTQQFVVWTNGGICMLRVQLSNKFVGRNIRTFMTKKQTSNRNYFAHPTVLQVETGSDDENTWFVPRLFWQERVRVPDEMQRACATWRARIKEALELGKLSDTEDEAPTQEAPASRATTTEGHGDIPF
jgi:hypothetical protein